jgi:hypothetical protein
MVASGVTRKRLPAGNDVVCTLLDPSVPALARTLGTTRTAAAMELWRERLGGAVVVVGNAPTALFRLLELVDDGRAPPAAVIGVPVGFIGAAESKDALAARPDLEHLVVRGRRGRQRDRRSRASTPRVGGEVSRAPVRRRRRSRRPRAHDVKAPRTIEAPTSIAYPTARHGNSVARRDRRAVPAAGQIEVALTYPVTTETTDHPAATRAPARLLRRARGALAEHLDAGRDVAVLCEGDPFFYGSYMYLHERLAHATRPRSSPA